MIDTSKIRRGDTGTIEVTFGERGAGNFIDVIIRTVTHAHAVPVSIIASHTPSPWVPEKGDLVKWNAAGVCGWEVVAVEGEQAWIQQDSKRHIIAHISALTLIRKGAA